MRRWKTHFEQIPVRIVKMMVEELPAKEKLATSARPVKTCREKYPRFTQQKENLHD